MCFYDLFVLILATEYRTVLVQVISVLFCIPPSSQLSFSRRLFPGVLSKSSLSAHQAAERKTNTFFFFRCLQREHSNEMRGKKLVESLF